ncbi:MAG: Clp protease N-terminal domain-containing protein, partial [Syntrophaceae bacterium]|nr:Clp protease N-terminal domain-containing protein [Syntrophaceae bacterium]
EGLPTVSGAGQPYLTPRLNDMLHKALTEAARLGDEYVSVEHVLGSIADDKDGSAGKILNRHGVTRDAIMKVLVDIRGTSGSPIRIRRTSIRPSSASLGISTNWRCRGNSIRS